MVPGVHNVNVILYGNSLILEGVRASLSTCADIQIRQLDLRQESALKKIQEWSPSVLIFDLDAARVDIQLGLLQQPGVVLVGISAETQQALVWSGRQIALAAAADLLCAIQQASADLAT